MSDHELSDQLLTIINYCFYQGSNPFGEHDCNFNTKRITDYVQQVDINDDNNEIPKYINFLVLALGLTYSEQNGDYIPFYFPEADKHIVIVENQNFDRYFYYDLQEAAYK